MVKELWTRNFAFCIYVGQRRKVRTDMIHVMLPEHDLHRVMKTIICDVSVKNDPRRVAQNGYLRRAKV